MSHNFKSEVLLRSLSKSFSAEVIQDLFEAKASIITSYGARDFADVLLKGARFAEHCLRMLEFKRTGVCPSEIKSFSGTVEKLRNDASLPESIKLTIPRMLEGSAWELRNRRDHIHVKELDPTEIDASVVNSVTDWVIAELVRVYSDLGEDQTYREMRLLVEPNFTNIVEVLGEVAFSRALSCTDQVLTLICKSGEKGISRLEIGEATTYPSGSVSHSLKTLMRYHLVHYSKTKSLYVPLPSAIVALRVGFSNYIKQTK